MLLLPDLKRPADFAPVIKRLLARISEPVDLPAGSMQVSASIGITFHPQSDTSAEQLIQQADQAMYQAKRMGLTSISFSTRQGSIVQHTMQPVPDVIIGARAGWGNTAVTVVVAAADCIVADAAVEALKDH